MIASKECFPFYVCEPKERQLITVDKTFIRYCSLETKGQSKTLHAHRTQIRENGSNSCNVRSWPLFFRTHVA